AGELGHPAGSGTPADQVCSGVSCNATPQKVAGLGTITGFSVGDGHTCALAGGAVACWGYNGYGALGLTFDNFAHPSPATVVGGSQIAEVSGRYRHTCARTTSGDVYCWGSIDRGELGLGGVGVDAGGGVTSCNFGVACNGMPHKVPGLSSVAKSIATGIG